MRAALIKCFQLSIPLMKNSQSKRIEGKSWFIMQLQQISEYEIRNGGISDLLKDINVDDPNALNDELNMELSRAIQAAAGRPVIYFLDEIQKFATHLSTNHRAELPEQIYEHSDNNRFVLHSLKVYLHSAGTC